MARSIPEDRFQDLIDAATAVFLEQGYRRTQVADVAARMGLAKGSVYTYVESKEALFDYVLRHADHSDRIDLPETLPVGTPPPGATLEMVQKRLVEESRAPLPDRSALPRAGRRRARGAGGGPGRALRRARLATAPRSSSSTAARPTTPSSRRSGTARAARARSRSSLATSTTAPAADGSGASRTAPSRRGSCSRPSSSGPCTDTGTRRRRPSTRTRRGAPSSPSSPAPS